MSNSKPTTSTYQTNYCVIATDKASRFIDLLIHKQDFMRFVTRSFHPAIIPSAYVNNQHFLIQKP
jgi:hypothetical protein